jgi:hypothetical protein
MKSVAYSQGDEYPATINREKSNNWSHLAKELLSKTRYLRIDTGKDKSEGKTRIKT